MSMSFHRIMRPGLLAVSLIALAACKPQAPAKPPEAAATVPTEAEAAKIVDTAEAPWTSVDTAKIMSAYKEGAVMFDIVAASPSTDRATQNKWTDGFTAMKLTEKSIADKHVQVLDADTIVASGIATLKSGAQGEPISFRYSDVYERQPDGKWMIVHEHLSTPPGAEG
jgi:ketosteroid isomerase-like protein